MSECIPSYSEYQRCKHCSSSIYFMDALHDVCNRCIEKEIIEYACNECDHSWRGVGLQLRCVACNSTAMMSVGPHAVEVVRIEKLKKYFNELTHGITK